MNLDNRLAQIRVDILVTGLLPEKRGQDIVLGPARVRGPPLERHERALLPNPHDERHALPVHRPALLVPPARLERDVADAPGILLRADRAAPAPEARVLALPGRLGAQPLELDHVRRERVGGVPIAGERPFG